jgi:DNA-binding transcriptional ArsR family regulator
MLLDGPRHVMKLNADLQIEPTLFSHHLRVLRDAGIVVARRDERTVLLRTAAMVLAGDGRAWISAIAICTSTHPPA